MLALLAMSARYVLYGVHAIIAVYVMYALLMYITSALHLYL